MHKFPNNIRSIIIALDNELKDEFYNKSFSIQVFKQLISSLLIYYFDSFYRRLFFNNPNNLIKDKYVKKIYTFINNLQITKVYNEVFANIYIFIYNIYIDLYIDNLLDDNIVYIISENDNPIYNLINTIKDLKYYRNQLDILNISILFVNKFENYKINNICIENIPSNIKFIINGLLMNINIDIDKNIIFIKDKSEIKNNNKVYIYYNQNIKQIQKDLIAKLQY